MKSLFLRQIRFIICMGLSFANATTYYVDSNPGTGSDANNGTGPSTPWLSLSKVNNSSFSAGDSVLFRRGGSWTGQLGIWNAGTAGNHLYFGAYGTGAKPAIHGGGSMQAAIYIKNSCDHVTVEGFAVTNHDGSDVFDGAEALRHGIQIGMWGGDLTDIVIRGNEVYWVEGYSNHGSVGSPRGTSLEPSTNNQYHNGGIYANGSVMDSLTIERNYVHDCTNTGIFVFVFDQTYHTLIQNNAVCNVGSDGIEVLNSTAPLIQYNSCVNAGNNSGDAPRGPGVLGFNGLAVCGIWSYGCTSPLFQYNYCAGTKQIKYDGQGWDFDLKTRGTAIYQYNYSRDNEGGFTLSDTEIIPGLVKIFRYNISVNDGSRHDACGQGYFNGHADYYNNIFYRTDGKGFNMTSVSPVRGTFTNNVFYTNATTDITYQSGDRIFTNNAFYGHTPQNPGSNPVTADPLFENPAGITDLPAGSLFTIAQFRAAVDGFRLKNGSPLIDAGAVLAGNGGIDFWGDTLYTGSPDIGAYEAAAARTSVAAAAAPVTPAPFTAPPAAAYQGILYTIEGKAATGAVRPGVYLVNENGTWHTKVRVE